MDKLTAAWRVAQATWAVWMTWTIVGIHKDHGELMAASAKATMLAEVAQASSASSAKIAITCLTDLKQSIHRTEDYMARLWVDVNDFTGGKINTSKPAIVQRIEDELAKPPAR